MALKRNGESVAMENANHGTEKINNGDSNVDGFSDPNWNAPDPVTRPTLFSAGGEDPMAQLDLYCKSHSAATNNNSTTTSKTHDFGNDPATVADANELLSVAEFLFGHKALTAALSIVDSRRSLVTKLEAPSGRSVHVIRSSSSSTTTTTTPTTERNDANYHRRDGEQQYLCLLSPSQSSASVPPLRYCSCRSFLEKSTKKAAALAALRTGAASLATTSIHGETFHDGSPVCKHLLALFLLPHLAAASDAGDSNSYHTSYRHSYPEIKAITEKEFARFLLDRVL
jgi:hypothetical protein